MVTVRWRNFYPTTTGHLLTTLYNPFGRTGKISSPIYLYVRMRLCQVPRNINFFFDITFYNICNSPQSPGAAYFLSRRSLHVTFFSITLLKFESAMYFYPFHSSGRHIQSHIVTGCTTKGFYLWFADQFEILVS